MALTLLAEWKDLRIYRWALRSDPNRSTGPLPTCEKTLADAPRDTESTSNTEAPRLSLPSRGASTVHGKHYWSRKKNRLSASGTSN